jgi:hypothetical protein
MAQNSKTSEKIELKNVRLSFLRLDRPEAFAQGQAEKYQATALLDPSNAENAAAIKVIRAAAQKLCMEAYGEVPDAIKAAPLERLPFGEADKHPKKKAYDGYAGMFYVAASNTIMPGIANRKAQKVLPGEEQFPYSGCYGNVKVSLWALLGPKKNQFGPRVGANLIAVQFVKDGEAFGQGPINAEEEFEALEDSSPAVATASDDFAF